MLQDKARIFVKGGGGGDGCTSFRREAHVPRGGPDGGDGGHGGAVVISCDPSLRDLQSLGRRNRWEAGRGRHGEGANRRGADGQDLHVAVPPGTVVESDDGSVFDLTAPGQQAVVARGGSGGRGNARFKSSTRRAPRFAERGLEGEEHWLELRLKLLADVGLVGLPNAGKSSLVSVLTRARPKVGDYPFTTLEPQLGVLDRGGRQLVIADVPGLIEGASEGAGLGLEFLAHLERTTLLVHVVEIAPLDGSDPAGSWEAIENELRSHDEALAALPRVLALSKADLVDPAARERAAAEWSRRLGPDVPVVVTSSATREGIDGLADLLVRLTPEPGAAAPNDEGMAEHITYRPAPPAGWTVEGGDGRFTVTGPAVERLVARFDPDNEDAMAEAERRLRRMGVIAELEARGLRPGDEVEIAGVQFELEA
ncbi:MAG: GTPase ObgE [Solirubrobacterales bacterium]